MDSVHAKGASPSEDVHKDKEDNRKVIGCICVVKTRLYLVFTNGICELPVLKAASSLAENQRRSNL
jgi:hypothetical protein